MDIRAYLPGDEVEQAAIYNEAAGNLPKFKPATSSEILRRVNARDFDPAMRFFAMEGGKPVGYVTFSANGRVSYPWCRRGFERAAEPLFGKAMEAMTKRGFTKVFAAYRGDWPSIIEFLTKHGFIVAREMVNFTLEAVNTPTLPARPSDMISPLRRSDVPVVFSFACHVVRSATATDFEKHLFDNPYFSSDALFALRDRGDGPPRGVGILVRNVEYADPNAVDASMPCFRLGAFGTEGMQTKRMNGLFSFLCANNSQTGGIGSLLLSHAVGLLHDGDDVASLSAQAPSDAPSLLRFYQSAWRRQGSFPVLERKLV